MRVPRLALDYFAFGGDGNDDPPGGGAPTPNTAARSRRRRRRDDDDDDPDDDEDDVDDLLLIKNEKDRKIKRLSKENGRRRRSQRELREELDAKDDQIEELQGKLKTAEAWEGRHNKLKEELDGIKSAQTDQAIKSAVSNFEIAKDKKAEWHDSDMVLSMLDKSKLAINPKTGEVGGLDDQLKDLAKNKPFLLKSAGGTSEGNNAGPTGSTPQSSAAGTKGSEAAQDEAKIREMFSAFNSVV